MWSECVQNVFRVCSECVQSVFRVCSECVQSVFKVCSECVQIVFRVCFISSPSASSVSVFGIFNTWASTKTTVLLVFRRQCVEVNV